MTSLPRYWTDPRLGVDYARGERLLHTEINAYRSAMTKLDLALEKNMVYNVSTLWPGTVTGVAAVWDSYHRDWIIASSGSSPTAMWGWIPSASGNMDTGGYGITISEMAAAELDSALEGTVVACGTPTGSSNKKYRVSADGGSVWAVCTSSATSAAGITSICWHIDRFVAGGAAGFVEYSTTGTSFVAATPANSNAIRRLRSNGTVVIGISSASTNKVVVSTDGVTWAERTLPGTITATGIVWCSGTSRWYVTGDSVVFSSSDGITWGVETWTWIPGILDVISTGNFLFARAYLGGDFKYGWAERDMDNGSSCGGVWGDTTANYVAVATDPSGVVSQVILERSGETYSSSRLA